MDDLTFRRMDIDGDRVDPVRNAPRAVIDVEPLTSTGTLVGAHNITERCLVEVYADQLSSVAARLDSPQHREVRKAAQRSYEIHVEQAVDEYVRGSRSDEAPALRAKWDDLAKLPDYENGMPTARLEFVVEELGLNISPAHYYDLEARRLGLPVPYAPPDLVRVDIVDVQSGDRLGLEEFLQLPRQERDARLLPPYPTAENAATVGADGILRAIQKTFMAAAQAQAPAPELAPTPPAESAPE